MPTTVPAAPHLLLAQCPLPPDLTTEDLTSLHHHLRQECAADLPVHVDDQGAGAYILSISVTRPQADALVEYLRYLQALPARTLDAPETAFLAHWQDAR